MGVPPAGSQPDRQPHGKLDAALNNELVKLEQTRPESGADLDPAQAARPVGVWVRFTGNLDEAIRAGFQPGVVTGEVATGTIALRDLERVADARGVIAITAVERYHYHLNDSVPAIHADHASVAAAGGGDGAGVIVGIVDTGIDVFHHNFRKDDGTTRILKLLDMTLRQTIAMPGGPTGGTFTLSWFGPASAQVSLVTTAAIPFNATAANIQAALTGFAGGVITAADITVAGGPLPGTPVTIDFAGRYAGQEVTKLWPDGSLLTGGNAPAITITRGREFSDQEINAALADPAQTFLSTDSVGHGTHVAGIAAGNGLQSGVTESGLCHGSGTFVGVAPAADLVVVKLTDWVTTLDPDPLVVGAAYIFTQAAGTPSKPAVVNLSLGGVGGAHDGTDPKEDSLNNLLDQAGAIPGRAIVVSAGNEGRVFDPDNPTEHDVGRHASPQGVIGPNGHWTFRFQTRAGDTIGVWIYIWYEGVGRLQFTLTPPPAYAPDPAGALAPPASAAAPSHRSLVLASNTAGSPNAATAVVYSYVDQPPTTWHGLSEPREKHKITLALTAPAPTAPPPPPPPGTASPQPLQIAAGTWTITLDEIAGAAVSAADAWMTHDDENITHDRQAMFDPGDQVRVGTVTVPGTAANVITVGNYDYRDNTLSPSSSRGPTTDTSTYPKVLKPDLCAPGQQIASAKSAARNTGSWCDCCYDFYWALSGTSMAAPHVTGLVALMFEKNGQLGYDDVRRYLVEGCQPPDPITGPTLPNADWGAGIVDGEQTLAHVVAAPHAAVPAVSAPDAAVPAAASPNAAVALPRERPPAIPHAAGLPVYAPNLHRLSALVSRACADPRASLAAALVSTHFDEVRRLVNTNRRILVVWHRMDGPRLLREALKFADGRPVQVPAEASGQPLTEWLDRLLNLLHEYGSPALRADVARYRPLVFELASALLTGGDEHRQAG
jgi:subtilisin family serine protease